MPNSLSVLASIEKCKRASSQPWLILVDVALPGETLRLVRNTESVVFRGNTYLAWPIQFDSVSQQASGELQTVTARLWNQDGMISGALEENGGGVGSLVTLRVINLANLAGEPDFENVYEIKETPSSAASGWASFTLAGSNPLRRAFPPQKILENHCPKVYNTPAMQAALDPMGEWCGYIGAAASCDRSLHGTNGCIAHGNQRRFGGHPGIGSQGWRAVSIQ